MRTSNGLTNSREVLVRVGRSSGQLPSGARSWGNDGLPALSLDEQRELQPEVGRGSQSDDLPCRPGPDRCGGYETTPGFILGEMTANGR